LLVFFSPRCGPCEDEVVDLVQYFKTQEQADFRVLLVAEESKKDLRRFKEEFELDFPIVYDAKGSAFEKYQVNLIPANFLISPDMKLIYSYIGAEGFSVYKIQAQVKFSGKNLK